jgi:hypothetical protein
VEFDCSLAGSAAAEAVFVFFSEIILDFGFISGV